MTGLLEAQQSQPSNQAATEIATDLPEGEAQKQYDYALEQGMAFLHSKDTREDITRVMQEAKSAPQAVGFALGMTMARIDILSKNELDSDVLDEVAQDLVSEVISMAISMRMITEDQVSKQFLVRAMRNAYQRYMEAMQAAGENGVAEEFANQIPDIMSQAGDHDLNDLEDEDKQMLMQLQKAQEQQTQAKPANEGILQNG